MSILENLVQCAVVSKDFVHAAKEKRSTTDSLLLLFFFLSRVRKALLAQQVVMECRVPWVCLALLDRLEYPERTETRPVTIRQS